MKSVPYNPLSNGIAERRIREIKDWFVKNTDESNPWDINIELCLHYPNQATPETTKTSKVLTKINPLKVGGIVYLQRKVKKGRCKEA